MKPRFVNRVRFLSFLFVAFALILIFRLYSLQIVSGETYSQRADRQYSKPESHIFSRGDIYFQNNGDQPFKAATLNACFIVAIQPNKITDIEAVWNGISPILPIEKVVFFERARKKDDPYEEIAKKVSAEDATSIRALKLTGVQIFEDRCRVYPGEGLASHAIGLLGFRGDEFGGRYGLERYYEDTLMRDSGEGYTNFFAEIFTNIKKTIFEDEELYGDVYTSLELQAQFFLEKKLAEVNKKWSSEMTGGIIMNPKTGEIIAMAVNPSFNPNSFQGEDVAVFSNPLVENVYEMGSIIKPLTIAAGIDAGVITPKTTYNDEGFLILNTARISNYDGKGRGLVDMQTVLNKSLNTGVAFVVSKLGNERFSEYFKALEFGEETGIDLPNETRGLIQNLDSTRDIEHATASYGQGIAMTPIGTVRALSTLANGGVLPHPHLAQEIKYEIGTSKEIFFPSGDQVFKQETTEEVTRMLIQVVDEALLDGKIKNPRYSVAAKTGTAQIANPSGGGYYADRFLHSFFGYFPAYNPQFLVFLYTVYPKDVSYASETLTESFSDITQFLINYYEVPPDR